METTTEGIWVDEIDAILSRMVFDEQTAKDVKTILGT